MPHASRTFLSDPLTFNSSAIIAEFPGNAFILEIEIYVLFGLILLYILKSFHKIESDSNRNLNRHSLTLEIYALKMIIPFKNVLLFSTIKRKKEIHYKKIFLQI